MASEDVQTNLRLPGDLKDRLVESADANNRSLSAEAALRLAASFDESGPPIAYVSFLQGELHRLNGQERKTRRLFRKALDMLGLFQGHMRQLGVKLTRGEEDDLSDLVGQIGEVINAPGVRDAMLAEAGRIVEELEQLDLELEAAGLGPTSDERVALAEQKEKMELLKARKSKP